jgi:hypothetical protein
MLQGNVNQRHPIKILQCRQKNLDVLLPTLLIIRHTWDDMDAAAPCRPVAKHPNRVLKRADRWCSNYGLKQNCSRHISKTTSFYFEEAGTLRTKLE